MNYTSILRIILIIFFAIGIIICIGMISLNIELFSKQDNSIIKNISLLSNYAILLAIFVIGFIFTKSWNHIFHSISKILMVIFSTLLTISILLLSIHLNSQEITNSIQPTIDQVTIQTINNTNIDTSGIIDIKKLILDSHTIKKYSVNSISKKEGKTLLNHLNITSANYINTSNMLLSMSYDKIRTRDPQLLSTPIPITLINKQIETIEYKKLIDTNIVNKNYTINPNASLYLIHPYNITNSTTTLAHLREKCKNIPQNIVCDQLSKTYYSSILSMLERQDSNNKSLKIFKQINTTQKLNTYIEEKTQIGMTLFIFTIIMIFIVIGLKILDYKVNNKPIQYKSIALFFTIRAFILFFITTLGFVALNYFLKSRKTNELFQSMFRSFTQEPISFQIQSLPLLTIITEIIKDIIVIYLILVSFLLISIIIIWYFKHKNND